MMFGNGPNHEKACHLDFRASDKAQAFSVERFAATIAGSIVETLEAQA
jgi:hypothetical protein